MQGDNSSVLWRWLFTFCCSHIISKCSDSAQVVVAQVSTGNSGLETFELN